MATTTRIDELNILQHVEPSQERGERYIPYEQYFGEMGLPEEKIRERIRAAEDMEETIVFFILLILAMTEFGNENVDRAFIENQIAETYRGKAGEILTPTDGSVINFPENGQLVEILDEYVKIFAESILGTTLDHKDDPYYTSAERAKYLAENEANVILNLKDFAEAVGGGSSEKEWKSMKDKDVRSSHRKVDDVRIPIDQFFEVGSARLMYPKDVAFGNGSSHPEEIIGCRCWVEYF